MTGQVSDVFIFRGEEYSLVSVKSKRLFNPEDYKIKLVQAGSSCWRGYQALYQIKNNKLILNQLLINMDGKSVQINNKKAEISEYRMFMYNYPELDLAMNFTGSIRIAKDFIRDLYVHSGFQKESSYETVFELHFKRGKVKKEEDISQVMVELRDLYKLR